MIATLKLQPRQIDAAQYWIDDTTEEILYGGAKGGAKTFLGCSLIFADALLYPGTHYFIARQNLNDLTKFTTPSIIEVFSFMGLAYEKYMSYNGQNSFFQLHNGSKVFYIDCKWAPSDPEYHRFGSLQFTRGWFEEIGQINSMAIINLSASVGRWKNTENKLKRKILMTCNPNKGYAYNNFYLPSKKNALPEYKKFVKALPTDNKYLTEDYLNSLERLPANERERLKYGNWEYDSDPNTMIDLDMINNMFSNIYAEKGIKRIVSDIARYGSDRAIIAVWEGFVLIEYIVFDISSTVQIKNAINALRVKHNIQLSNIVVDEDGVGGGVVDGLRCKGFVNNSKAPNPVYQNLKSECGYKLAEFADKIYISCDLPDNEIEMIHQELGMLKTYDSDKDGKLRIMPKEKIKEHIGRSPDWLDIFIMRMYFEVAKISSGVQTWHT
jgi:phage terminase large subunit